MKLKKKLLRIIMKIEYQNVKIGIEIEDQK